MVPDEKTLRQLERKISPELKESKFATCLELEIESRTSASQVCEVFITSETAPLETAPLTEDLM